MNNDNQQVIYCEDDGEYRFYCSVCDKLCIGKVRDSKLKFHLT